ncbi:hypothetical protein CU097_012037, partial [Rhizopus azygosporus]
KRSQRSKNKSDSSSNINFVFNPDQPLSRSLSFTGSAPTSPAASATGFNIAGTASSASSGFGSGNKQPFVFGNASSTQPSNAFNFSSPGSQTFPSPLKRGVSELPTSGQSDRNNALRRSTSEFSFSTTSNPSAPNPFGTSLGAAPISFGTPAASNTPGAITTSTSGFAPAASTTGNAPAFSFAPVTGSTSATQAGTSTPAPAFTFGATSTTAPSTSSGAFNNTTSTAAPTSTSTTQTTDAFSFGSSTAKPSTTTTTTTSGFTFGKASEPASSTAAPAFTFSKPAEAPPAASTSAFSFGKSVEAPKANPAPSFSFAKPAESTQASQAASTTGTASTAATASATTTSSSPFTFGGLGSTSKPSTTPATTSFTFGTSTSTASAATTTTATTTATTATSSAAPVFSFGATASTSKPAPSLTSGTPTSTSSIITSSAPTTTTTTTTTAATTSSSAPTFSFGASTTTTEKKDDKGSAPIVTSNPFTFGTTASTSTSSSSTTPGITTNAPTTTTTISQPVEAKPNPFSFTKVLDDLSKISTQPPSQIYASLVTPSLASLYQTQVVHHTNFRIDNITSTTRFTELPEQAQKELDEVEKYIRLESQRSEYIRNHKMPQQTQLINKCKEDIEALSQKMDALSSMLKMRLESTESLYDDVKEQLRHANDGCAVIEACRHPGTAPRWLFGRSDEDDYFSLLAKQLASRLEEYKKCIWEIERTAESWSKNRAQSPQDIARIMHAQNQTFLALANKVASLHEAVEREKEYYKQYFKVHA